LDGGTSTRRKQRREEMRGLLEGLLGNCFLHHITALNCRGKDENALKKMGYI